MRNNGSWCAVPRTRRSRSHPGTCTATTKPNRSSTGCRTRCPGTHPMLGDLQVAYLGVEVPDTTALGAFLSDVVGLVPGEGPDTWRNDSKSQRIIATEGPAADATVLGFEAADVDAWAATVARLEHAGYPAAAATDEEANARCVEQLAYIDAPWGVRVEVTHGLADAAQPFVSPLVGSGFVTDDKGFGHVVFGTTAFDESH